MAAAGKAGSLRKGLAMGCWSGGYPPWKARLCSESRRREAAAMRLTNGMILDGNFTLAPRDIVVQGERIAALPPWEKETQ